MKVNTRVPLVHLGRIRQHARVAGCQGTLAFVEGLRKVFLERKQPSKNIPLLPFFVVPEYPDPVFGPAWEELCDVVIAAYGEEEERLEISLSLDDEDDDLSVFFRFFLHVVETIPTLRPEVRDTLDQYFGQAARDWAAAT